MTDGTHQKVTSRQLRRNAYLYVRQSTLRQVFQNGGAASSDWSPMWGSAAPAS